jgi:5-bromo-4-chloroindolyl phosphate hydrolysis protein
VAFLKYSLIRLALFVPLFVLFALLHTGLLLAAIFAGLIAFAISYLFFKKQRDDATASMRERFSGRAKPIRSALEIEDAAIEDRLVDENPVVKVENDRRPKEG